LTRCLGRNETVVGNVSDVILICVSTPSRRNDFELVEEINLKKITHQLREESRSALRRQRLRRLASRGESTHNLERLPDLAPRLIVARCPTGTRGPAASAFLVFDASPMRFVGSTSVNVDEGPGVLTKAVRRGGRLKTICAWLHMSRPEASPYRDYKMPNASLKTS
jgi:hypothetical protein